MTWLGLAVALQDAGSDLALVGSRHAARLRGAISGKNKSDVNDADVLARAGDVFELHPLVLASPPQLALRRACTRRGAAVIDGNRHLRRLISLARWAFPDLRSAFGGSLPTAVAVLGRWPHLESLPAARRSSLTAVVAEHTRGVGDVPARVEKIRSAAAAWAHFWAGHLDLDALAWDVNEHLADMAMANARIHRVTTATQRYWEQLHGDDPLLVPTAFGLAVEVGGARDRDQSAHDRVLAVRFHRHNRRIEAVPAGLGLHYGLVLGVERELQARSAAGVLPA